jgi:hypothetical protein
LLLTDVNVQSTTVGEYLETWLAGKHALKPRTVALYRVAIDHYLAPHLGNIGLLELRAHHLDRFYATIAIGNRGKPLSPSSIRRGPDPRADQRRAGRREGAGGRSSVRPP